MKRFFLITLSWAVIFASVLTAIAAPVYGGAPSAPNTSARALAILLADSTPAPSPTSGPLLPSQSGPAAPTSRATQAAANPTTVTELVMDVSGSMGEAEASGKTKLEGAKVAANLVFDRMLQETSLGRAEYQVGAVAFESAARVISPPLNDLAAVKRAIQGMTPNGQTNIGDGLTKALDDLQATYAVSQTIILLSDGLANVGLTSAQQFLDGPVARARRMGVCIHTVGLGEGGQMNAALLQAIAQGTGCGKYYLAKDAFQLAATYVRLVHETWGQNVQVWEGTITQGEDKPLGDYGVPGNQELLDVSLVWPGSKLEVVLRDPKQTIVGPGYPGAQIYPGAANQRVVVQNPVAGNWQVSIKGVEVPEGRTAFSAAASVRPQVVIVAPTASPTLIPTVTPTSQRTPQPTVTLAPSPRPTPAPAPASGGEFGWLLLIALIGGGAVAVMVFWGRRRRARGEAWLEVAGGVYTGHRIPLRQTPFRIGRSSDNALVLDDPSVSRTHALIHFTGGGYVLDDQGGRGSTYVNGQSVLRAALQPGDRIRLGDVEFVFQRR